MALPYSAEKAQTQRTPTPRTQRENKALFYGLFSFVTSPALQPTQCGASVVSFVVKKIFPLKTVEPKESMKAKLRSLRSVLTLLVIMILAACSARGLVYKGTCAEQTQQFLDYIHALVRDELLPVIDDGFISGPTTEVTKRLEDLNTRISRLDTPECNTRTKAVKEALLVYMVETRNYFSVVAGRAVYGEGPVQGQRSKMNEAGLAFEIAFEDLRK